jgi:hypothetical protein
MDRRRVVWSTHVVTRSGGRRDAMRSLSAMGITVLAALGRADASAQGGLHAARKKKHKKPGSGFATRYVASEQSEPLPHFVGASVSAFADCGGDGQVVSCGYELSGTAGELTTLVINVVRPTPERSGCVAGLYRASDSATGATIQAVAICLV